MLAGKTLLVIWTVLVIAMQVWLFKAAPPKEFIRKYSRRILLLSIIPFMSSWKNIVEPGDVEIIERYRKKMFWYVFIVVVSGATVCTYLYLQLRAHSSGHPEGAYYFLPRSSTRPAALRIAISWIDC